MSSECKPRLTESLKASYLIREGQPVKLSCRFDASPTVDIQWLKDGIPIDFEALGISRDFKVVKEVDYTALLIKEAFPEDTGSYTVIIRNSLGEARSVTQLNVEEFFCRTPESEMSDTPCKPVFVQPLLDITINDGEKLKLHAAINAYPEPEIIWYRNNIPLKNSRDLTLTFDGQLCKLIKDRCEKENDAGVYRITAVNSMGQVESVCQVIVQSNETKTLRERLQSTRSLPIFIQSLQDKTFQEGEKLLFRVQINGQPKPQVIWYKDKQPLRNTHDHKIRTEDDTYILEIPKLSINDAGLYEVKAINTEGEAKCSAIVNILPINIIPEPMIIESNGSAPEFLQLFKDQKPSIGSTTKLEARVIGTKPLNVYWLFNGSPLVLSGNNRRYQLNVFNDTYTLIIHNVHYDDVGKYTLNAENSWGKATCTAELFIPPIVSKFGRKLSYEIYYF
ncbi:unnamed protein product [Rotaria sp. Silwood2]|nr:unnamed protein product [Rotaria sp. Silwood2]CAF2830593.1 unnamed protein product [Rotaria sp. Silwood2]CAF2983509.1 unnamed protein product [Rotaria sp. Silwood2]CAF3888519.1 unnamed protein product [Rotaria sp. Silwood2]CAF4062424.1 unnamed protein product [Rotaria sp. Silwood2]